MRIVLILAAITIVFTGCDDRKDYFIDINHPPQLTIAKGGVELKGSLTDSLKIGIPYTLQYSIADEEKLTLSVVQEQGNENSVVTTNTVTITGEEEGLSKIMLVAQDAFGAQANFPLTFTVFRNLPPITSFTAKIIGISSPYEVEVDASKSYDQDAKFGGKISLYEYTFQDYTFTSSEAIRRYIFGSSGQKLIKVRVQDNNGDWSTYQSTYVVL